MVCVVQHFCTAERDEVWCAASCAASYLGLVREEQVGGGWVPRVRLLSVGGGRVPAVIVFIVIRILNRVGVMLERRPLLELRRRSGVGSLLLLLFLLLELRRGDDGLEVSKVLVVVRSQRLVPPATRPTQVHGEDEEGRGGRRSR